MLFWLFKKENDYYREVTTTPLPVTLTAYPTPIPKMTRKDDPNNQLQSFDGRIERLNGPENNPEGG